MTQNAAKWLRRVLGRDKKDGVPSGRSPVPNPVSCGDVVVCQGCGRVFVVTLTNRGESSGIILSEGRSNSSTCPTSKLMVLAR